MVAVQSFARYPEQSALLLKADSGRPRFDFQALIDALCAKISQDHFDQQTGKPEGVAKVVGV